MKIIIPSDRVRENIVTQIAECCIVTKDWPKGEQGMIDLKEKCEVLLENIIISLNYEQEVLGNIIEK